MKIPFRVRKDPEVSKYRLSNVLKKVAFDIVILTKENLQETNSNVCMIYTLVRITLGVLSVLIVYLFKEEFLIFFFSYLRFLFD